MVLATRHTRFLEVTEDAGAAVDPHALVVELTNLRGQLFAGLGPWGKPLTQPRVITTAVYLENTAQAGQAKLNLVRLHERVLHPDCLAKYAATFFRISRSSVVRLELNHFGLQRLKVTWLRLF